MSMLTEAWLCTSAICWTFLVHRAEQDKCCWAVLWNVSAQLTQQHCRVLQQAVALRSGACFKWRCTAHSGLWHRRRELGKASSTAWCPA